MIVPPILKVAAVPVPVNVTDCGLPDASLVTVRLALRAPVVVGANATDTVQFAAIPRLAAQELVVIVKSAGFAPVRTMEEMFTAVALRLVRVTTWAAVVLPTVAVAKLSDGGVTVRVFVGAVTVNVVEPEITPLVAAIVEVPA